jgi:hypothetical protein
LDPPCACSLFLSRACRDPVCLLASKQNVDPFLRFTTVFFLPFFLRFKGVRHLLANGAEDWASVWACGSHLGLKRRNRRGRKLIGQDREPQNAYVCDRLNGLPNHLPRNYIQVGVWQPAWPGNASSGLWGVESKNFQGCSSRSIFISLSPAGLPNPFLTTTIVT